MADLLPGSIYGNICTVPAKKPDRCLKRHFYSLLPKKLNDRDALNFEFLNIKPRLLPIFSWDIRRLKYIIVTLLFLGYFPTINIPVVATNNRVLAAEQTATISADSLPEPLKLPHPGYLSTKYSYYHPAVDIATGLSMPIHSIAQGKVTMVDYGFWGLGHSVTISHLGGFESTYGHMGRIFVKTGQDITTGNTIGEVGLTGHTSGPHTHLEIKKDGKYIDPLTILPAIPNFPREEDFRPVGGAELRKTLKPDFS